MIEPILTQDYSSITIEQPNDTFHSSFDESDFVELNSMLSANNESLAMSAELPMDPREDSSGNTIIVYNDQDGTLYDWANCFEDPINEVTVETNDPENNTDDIQQPSPSNETISKIVDDILLELADKSIQDRVMSVEVQPPKNLHSRYASDGKRQLEKSRTNPMAIKLPSFNAMDKTPLTTLMLRLSLVTYNENSSTQTYFHVNQLEYHADDVHKLNDGTVCVPLSDREIEEKKKKLPRLAIIKKKLSAYRSELKPFQLVKNDEQSDEIESKCENMSVKDAKKIQQKYNLKASRIHCQLVMKRNGIIHGTDIVCETNVLEQNSPTGSTKRVANDTDSDHEERHSVKRKKTT